ncbi:HAD family hydrolase [Nocardia caishijiensis]|uniref:HAD superfamily hydrolase (TIGR01509 family)/HAD superfamily hydrolase (TIGR01549 family) n=1 Tax=Nocardia caishijiensis TaxID=184756 RepID=A0ABQ6YP30_9NOCA|nr:HAD family phosphatase [Nocardia caishijiensis]KAF0847201.1 HAD superfamily hydrolase (TIGR01509 family)/HAD superfamily hydrolase (TIGR01549 family) [Nocardia caishijiensis]
MSARPAAVLWDMDGTLLDSEKLWDIAVRELAREHGHEMTDELRHALIGASGPNALRMLFDGIGVTATPQVIAAAGEFLERRVSELMLGPIPWRPGALDALTMVRAEGLRCALVTNTKRSLTEHGLDTLGRHFFDLSVCGDEVAHGKPAPDIYLRAAELLGVDPADCVALEDSPTGALAAQGAGCAVIVIPCEIEVPEVAGRVFRESLTGLSMADLRAAFTVRDGRAAATA